MDEAKKEKLNKVACLEAVLFSYGEPIGIDKISKILGVDEEEVKEIVNQYDLLLKNDENRGLTLLFGNDKIQIGTKPNLSFLIEKIVESEINEDLTPAAIETLSLVLYFSPISKSKIDYHRGVDSGFILRNLMLKGLVERKQNPEMLNSYLYYPTIKLLRHLGVPSIEYLPDYDKFQDLNKKFELLSKKRENMTENNRVGENYISELSNTENKEQEDEQILEKDNLKK